MIHDFQTLLQKKHKAPLFTITVPIYLRNKMGSTMLSCFYVAVMLHQACKLHSYNEK